MDEEPPIIAKPVTSPRKSSPRQVAYGFVAGLAIFALGYLPASRNGYANLVPFILSLTLLPLAALVLAIIRPTRSFGLGLVLACGVLWLVALAICGGLFRSMR
jgi:hypothetical protein